MTTIDAILLSHCRNLAFTVAPELRHRPLYLVNLSLFDGLPGISKGNCLAWASSGAPVQYDFRERIGDAWKGPGPIVALDGQAIAEAASCVDAFSHCVYNVVLHELAHLLPPPVEYPTRDFAELFDFPHIREHQELKRVKADSLPEPLFDSEHNCHNAEFVRICTHLLGRAQLAGWQISSFCLFGDALWFASQPPHWLIILLREVVEQQGEPFAEIIKIPPPAEFTELWDSCLNFHAKRETICKEQVQ